MFSKRKPMMNIEIDIDQFQKEKISIYSANEIKKKLGQFLTTYTINDPCVKKRIMERVSAFVNQIQDKKVFREPIQEFPQPYTPNDKTMSKLCNIAKRKQNLKERIKHSSIISPHSIRINNLKMPTKKKILSM
jgi:hypothetical protein